MKHQKEIHGIQSSIQVSQHQLPSHTHHLVPYCLNSIYNIWRNLLISTKCSHHHNKHEILVDKGEHSGHTQHNSSIVSSNWHFQYSACYSFHSICKLSHLMHHSILHRSLGAVEPMKTAPSLLQPYQLLYQTQIPNSRNP